MIRSIPRCLSHLNTFNRNFLQTTLFHNQRAQCETLNRNLCTVALPKDSIDEDLKEFDMEFVHNYPPEVCNYKDSKNIDDVRLELDVFSRFHYDTVPMPKSFLPSHWIQLLEKVNCEERKHFCRFLFMKEKLRMLKRKRQEEKRILLGLNKRKLTYDEVLNRSFKTSDVVPYEYHSNSLFGKRFLCRLTKRIGNYKVAQKAILGPHIIIDCCYEDYMINTELMSCARQLSMVRKVNRETSNPFNVIHCNMNPNGKLIENLKKMAPNIMEKDSIFHHTEKSFLDLFPKEKLIYLSPHSDDELETYDHDSIYIIGALVDKIPKTGLSVEKANLSGVRTVKFPLDKYFNWCQGTKCLMLYQAVKILLDLKEGVSWENTLSENIRHDRTVFSGVYWDGKDGRNEKNSTAKYIENMYFLEHITYRE